MPKAFSILFPLILIFKIVFSSQWTTIEMEDFESTNTQNNHSNNVFPPTHFENTNVIKIRSNFKLNNLFIFLSSDKFKYCILPYLSSLNFVQIFLHFQNLVPELNFQKFLPPSRFYTTNNVLDIQEPTTYLQPLEINVLYRFNGEYLSLQPNILYSSKNKIPTFWKSNLPSGSDYICAQLSENKIIPYETFHIHTSGQKLAILRDNDGHQFFVTFEKTKGQFNNIAKCSEVSEIEFCAFVESIWEAFNLKGWKGCYWTLKYFLNIPYENYVFYVVKIILSLTSCLNHILGIFEYIYSATKNHNFCVWNFVFVLCAPFVVILVGVYLAIFFVWYYAIQLPFLILSYPFKQFVFGFNLVYFFLFSQGLASLYVCFFPQIKNCIPFFRIREIKTIEPQKIMSVVPLLVQKRKDCLEECIETLRFCYLIFLCGFPATLTLLFTIPNVSPNEITIILAGFVIGAFLFY